MSDGGGRTPRPRWVRTILWGLPTRTSAWASAWLCLAIAGVSVAYAALTADRRFLVGGIMVLGTIGYVLSIRWVNRHGSWEETPRVGNADEATSRNPAP